MELERRMAREIKQAFADPDLIDRIKANPEKELPELREKIIRNVPVPLESDVWIYRGVVGALGLTVLSAVIGAIILASLKVTPVPELLTAIGSAAVGALAGLLAPSPARG